MAKKLFIGGLSPETAEENLKDIFSKAGTVESINIIKDKFSGRPKGFGFVEMSSEEEGKKAIEMLNGTEINGKNVTVSEARPIEPRPRRGGFNRNNRGRFGGNRQDRW